MRSRKMQGKSNICRVPHVAVKGYSRIGTVGGVWAFGREVCSSQLGAGVTEGRRLAQLLHELPVIHVCTPHFRQCGAGRAR